MIYSKRRKNLKAKNTNRNSFRLKRNRKNAGSGVVDWLKQKTHTLDKDTIIRKIKKYNQIIKDNEKDISSYYTKRDYSVNINKSEELLSIYRSKLEDLKNNARYNEAITEIKQIEEREAGEKKIMEELMIKKQKEDAIQENLRCNLILQDINDINTYHQKMKEAKDTNNQRDINCLNKRYTMEYINQKKTNLVN
jgi:hypothetical protein